MEKGARQIKNFLIPSGQFPAACRVDRHSGESRSPEKSDRFRAGVNEGQVIHDQGLRTSTPS